MEPADLIDTLLQPDVDPVQGGVALKQLADDPQIGGDHLLSMMTEKADQLPDADPALMGGLLRLIHIRILQNSGGKPTGLQTDWIAMIARQLSPEVANRYLLLQLLSLIRNKESLGALNELLADCPPRGWMAAGQILSPLMQHSDWPVDALFPGVLDRIVEPALAAPILDLAGHLVRSHRVAIHPAADRVTTLNRLLGSVAERLAKFEEDPRSFGTDVDQVQAILGEAVALAVSLCDAVGLIGDPSSIGELNKAAELRHRRVQCEAAGALARLGEGVGAQHLIALTQEPSARLRAIAYADELGIGDQIDPQYREPDATAEAEVALWLSQPQQMGVPPTHVEVIDSRRILWPSYHDPVDVFLVRFEYSFGERQYSNIAIAGPTTFALSADVADLPPEDIYAIYAGWHAEHDDIFTVGARELNDAQVRLTEPMRAHLERLGYEALQVELLGFFLDETAAIFSAERDGTQCLVVTDGLETMDLPTAGRLRPPQSRDMFHLYKGRKMLRSFNPQGI
ncbi:HEAT repeat domain-containing protein [Neorhodopirellula pilleata]|uniref:Uncharacterized protein n=1 Tax=Neorhodopirellula pilleata TaxID=2714738 RepID=A0A5C6AEM6_9BACT|nr:HEAT repeat domain-containing protein [Neorhodopirellula pilleata]TWT97521.1 hypothetical protein Pla100_26750 [Neorhodopirellula pilleata]